jgi:hypothetical protein
MMAMWLTQRRWKIVEGDNAPEGQHSPSSPGSQRTLLSMLQCLADLVAAGAQAAPTTVETVLRGLQDSGLCSCHNGLPPQV